MEKVASLQSYATSSASTAYGVFTANEIAAYGGLFFAAATYFTNLVFKIRAERRASRQTTKKAA